jgi:hypothetical protein
LNNLWRHPEWGSNERVPLRLDICELRCHSKVR